MPRHTAANLFELNIKSAEECITLHAGIVALSTRLDVSWLLRSSVVFAISAMDAYFHDKIIFRAGKYGISDAPIALRNFPIKISQLSEWDNAKRPGNVIRNWISQHYSTRPLLNKDAILNALKTVGIEDVWTKIEADDKRRIKLLSALKGYVDRRNQIAHEGDRWRHRSSGKKLRDIDVAYAKKCIEFTKDVVARVEKSFPK